MLETTSVRRFCLEAGDFKIEIERAFAKGAATQAVPAGASAAPLGSGAGEAPTRHTVLAPLVGTFYQSPNAGAKPFVEVGSRVQRGQIIAIIEAMKVMNEVLADAAGVVVGILVQNGHPVQYEQPLLDIDTTRVTRSTCLTRSDRQPRRDRGPRLRACRELGIKTVAVYSKADAGSRVVQLADEAVCIGPGPARFAAI